MPVSNICFYLNIKLLIFKWIKVTETFILLKSKQNSSLQSVRSSIIQEPSLKHARTSTNTGKGEILNRYSSS